MSALKILVYHHHHHPPIYVFSFVGADIAQLCTEAALQCIREQMEIIDIEVRRHAVSCRPCILLFHWPCVFSLSFTAESLSSSRACRNAMPNTTQRNAQHQTPPNTRGLGLDFDFGFAVDFDRRR